MSLSRANSSTLLSRCLANVKGCRCPSRNRTCGFPAYGSSGNLRFPVPDIRRQVRLWNVVVPEPQKLRIFQLPLLVTAIQHSAGGIFQIFPKTLNRMEISIYPHSSCSVPVLLPPAASSFLPPVSSVRFAAMPLLPAALLSASSFLCVPQVGLYCLWFWCCRR